MGTEYVQFALALVLFAGILIGSYWFVYAPGGNDGSRSSGGSDGSGGSGGSGAGNTSAPRVRRDDER